VKKAVKSRKFEVSITKDMYKCSVNAKLLEKAILWTWFVTPRARLHLALA